MDDLPCFFVNCGWLIRSQRLPIPYGLTYDLINGFGESLACLVDRDIQVAYRRRKSRLVGGAPVFSGASDAESLNLIRAQTSEQPHDRKRLDHRDRVKMRAVRMPAQVAFFKVHPGPQQLRPDIVVDDLRLRANKSAQAARRRERSSRVEAARNPSPFLNVAKEGAHGRKVMCLGFRGERLANPRLNLSSI